MEVKEEEGLLIPYGSVDVYKIKDRYIKEYQLTLLFKWWSQTIFRFRKASTHLGSLVI